MKVLLTLVVVLIAQAIPATAQSRERSLDDWLEQKSIPYVRQQLSTHPRFKGETVMFVVLRDNAPTPSSNALALDLRDRLLEAALDTNGVSVGWQQGRGAQVSDNGMTDCSDSDVHYYVGIELTQELDGRYAVNVRALDLEDRTWVSGFGIRWKGMLNTSARQALRQQRVDQTFLGARDVPFTLGQADLLARHLARELSCTLHQQFEGDYVVRALDEASRPELRGTVELIGNNLALQNALSLSAEDGDFNAVLTGKAHPINGTLHQYWLTVTPQSGNDKLAALSASAYIVLPEQVAAEPAPRRAVTRTSAPPAAPVTVSIPNAGADGFIQALRVVRPGNPGECPWPCSFLQTEANADAIVFFLQHQNRHGLVRLAGDTCRKRTAARVARAGETVRTPITRTMIERSRATETVDWSFEPATDTYYAVVVTDADLARQMANVMDRLPLRCGSASRPGMSGPALRDWLTEFASLAARADGRLDWRALEVRDIT